MKHISNCVKMNFFFILKIFLEVFYKFAYAITLKLPVYCYTNTLNESGFIFASMLNRVLYRS
jgi:hypothetical protein